MCVYFIDIHCICSKSNRYVKNYSGLVRLVLGQCTLQLFSLSIVGLELHLFLLLIQILNLILLIWVLVFSVHTLFVLFFRSFLLVLFHFHLFSSTVLLHPVINVFIIFIHNININEKIRKKFDNKEKEDSLSNSDNHYNSVVLLNTNIFLFKYEKIINMMKMRIFVKLWRLKI